MFLPVGMSTTRWAAGCSGCLKSSTIFDDGREYAEAQLLAIGSELRAGGSTWCVDCQRSAREVKQYDQRGRRRRDRRP